MKMRKNFTGPSYQTALASRKQPVAIIKSREQRSKGGAKRLQSDVGTAYHEAAHAVTAVAICIQRAFTETTSMR